MRIPAPPTSSAAWPREWLRLVGSSGDAATHWTSARLVSHSRRFAGWRIASQRARSAAASRSGAKRAADAGDASHTVGGAAPDICLAAAGAGIVSSLMERQDAYWWRLFATGLGFASFGAGGLVLGLLVFPLMRLLPGGAGAHRDRARAVVRAGFRTWIEFMRMVRAVDYRFEGRERLGRPGQLVIANHPSLIDVVFLLGMTPGASCVVKAQMWRNPFTRWTVTAAGYVQNAPADAMVEGAADTLAAGQSVIMFPEGTRTTPGKPLTFHRGAASIAVRAATTVTPVYVRCRPTTLTKAEPWYRIPPRRVLITFRVGEDFDLAPYRAMPSPALAARALNEAMRERYTNELGAG